MSSIVPGMKHRNRMSMTDLTGIERPFARRPNRNAGAGLRSCGQQTGPGTPMSFRRNTRAGALCATSAISPWCKEIVIDDLDLPYNERS